MIDNNLIEKLFSFQDLEYRSFNSKLIPSVEKEKIIGIRTPVLRKFANEFSKTESAKEFLSSPEHTYFEENNLHAFLIETIKDFDDCIKALDEFLPYVDNWSTCDCMNPKALAMNKERLLSKINEWISSKHTYTVRFAIKMLMTHFLSDSYKDEYANIVAQIQSDDYYLNMMRAWYFATAICKNYDRAVLFLENNKLDVWTHNKAISKCCDSQRLSQSTKEYLKKLKRKDR